MRPVHYYFIGAGSWFVCHGLQGVLFAWLVTMMLRESPGNVGLAQMAMLTPAMLLMLIGGSVADRFGGRRVAMVTHLLAVVPVLCLIGALMLERVDFTFMVLYALAMGCALAFVTPARDGLLNVVAEGRIQRTVVKATLIQFSVQACAALAAGLTQFIGPVAILSFQATALALGALAYSRIPATPPAPLARANPVRELMTSVAEGCATVWRSPSMRAVAGQNIAMGMFFMGSYIVTIPLLVRELYAGDAMDLALVQAVNGVGLITTMVLMLRGEDIERPGRALLLAHGIGGVFLGAAGTGLGFGALLGCLFLWGACGGVAMSMSRTIMQEQAPEGQRGRVMAFFSFSFMGAGPIGALACGFLVDWIGAGPALMLAAAAMTAIVLVFGLRSTLWELGHAVPARG